MNTFNVNNSVKLKKPSKRFKLNPKNKQKIILEAQEDYLTCSSLERLTRNLEFRKYQFKKNHKMKIHNIGLLIAVIILAIIQRLIQTVKI